MLRSRNDNRISALDVLLAISIRLFPVVAVLGTVALLALVAITIF